MHQGLEAPREHICKKMGDALCIPRVKTVLSALAGRTAVANTAVEAEVAGGGCAVIAQGHGREQGQAEEFVADI